MVREAFSAMKGTSLNERHTKLLGFVEAFQRKHRRQPSVREIQRGCGISSPAVVKYYLDYLKHNGYI